MNPYLRDIILRNREYEMERMDGRQGVKGSGKMRDRAYQMDGARNAQGQFTSGNRQGQGNRQMSRQGGNQGGQSRGNQGSRSNGGNRQGGSNQGGRDGAGYPYQGGMQGMMMNPNMGMNGNYPYNQGNDYAFGAEGEFYYDNDGRHYEEQNEYDQMGLNHSEFKRWKSMLKNADGTRGEKFDMNQIMPIAKQMNIDYRRFNEEDLVMAVNMLYSDYCKIFGNDITKYVAMAKAFLEDDDFDGTGSEKLATYFHCIVNKED